MSQPNLITKVRSRHPWEHALTKLPPENGRKNLFSHDSVSRVLFDLVQSVITWHRIYYTNVQGQRVKGQAQSVALRISNENVKSQERIGWSSGNCVKIIPQRIRRFLLYSEKKIKNSWKPRLMAKLLLLYTSLPDILQSVSLNVMAMSEVCSEARKEQLCVRTCSTNLAEIRAERLTWRRVAHVVIQRNCHIW